MEKKTSSDMDLEEWELLSKDGLYTLGRESRNPVNQKEMTGFHRKSAVDLNYFDPSLILVESMEDSGKIKGHALSPVSNRDDRVCDKEPDEKIVREIKMILTEDSGAVSPVLRKKLKEDNEFVDMKQPQMVIEYDDKEDDPASKSTRKGEEEAEEKEKYMCCEVKGKACWEGIGFNIWRWRISGIGALCSIGVAAATICVLILGGQNRQKQQNQNIQFQIYADDKQNLKQMVQHATRLNQAMSATRGVPTTRANISFGGYYDGL